jgi:hypothetical protein
MPDEHHPERVVLVLAMDVEGEQKTEKQRQRATQLPEN